MTLNLKKGETTFPPPYAENTADSQTVTIRENEEEKNNKNQASLTDPLLQKPTGIKNREKITSKGSSVTVQLNNIEKQADVTMQLSMDGNDLCKYGFFTLPSKSNANTFPCKIFQRTPSEKVSEKWEAEIRDAQQTDEGTVVLNFKNLVSLSGIMMQVNIVFLFISWCTIVMWKQDEDTPWQDLYDEIVFFLTSTILPWFILIVVTLALVCDIHRGISKSKLAFALMLISGIFGILAFTGSIVLAVQNKNNRHDHEYYGSYQRRGELGMFGGPSYRHNHEYYGSRQIRGDWPMYGKPSYRPDLEKYGNYWRRDEWETYGEPRYSSELPYYDDFQRRRELEIYGGPSYCSVWNCDTIVAGNVFGFLSAFGLMAQTGIHLIEFWKMKARVQCISCCSPIHI